MGIHSNDPTAFCTQPVFPVKPNGKAPLTKNGFKDASADQTRITAWQSQFPNCNWGMPTGQRSGIVVLDLDTKTPGADGLAWWEYQQHKCGRVDTFEVCTPSGGVHLYFQQPNGVRLQSNAGVLAPGVDCRAEGGYVVAPGSQIDGNHYVPINPDSEIAPLPNWLLAIWPRAGQRNSKNRKTGGITRPHTASSTRQSSRIVNGIVLGQGHRNDGLTRVAGRFWHSGVALEQLIADLLDYNQRWCAPPLPDWEVLAIANSVSRYEQTTRADLGAGGSLGDILTYADMAESLGSDLPKGTIFKAGNPNVRKTVPSYGVRNTVLRTSAKKRLGPRNKSALWELAVKHFPMPSGIKPRCKSSILHSMRKGATAVVDLLSNSWRNPANAMWNRRRFFFNVLPRITRPDALLYYKEIPSDDWTPKLRDSLGKRVKRKGAEWLWIDNRLRHGYVPCFSNTLVDDTWSEITSEAERLFVAALAGIEPTFNSNPDDQRKPHYYGGSEGWADKALSGVDKNENQWELVAQSHQPTDFALVEASAVMAGFKTSYDSQYWRGQAGSTLIVNTGLDIGKAEDLAESLGYALMSKLRETSS
ncbi:MAG: bifunctional DNA primase/polymerase [Chloroflexi bacterium]|nr:bifunctional DNA primase/polymerase [Chloroflexota bacterium]